MTSTRTETGKHISSPNKCTIHLTNSRGTDANQTPDTHRLLPASLLIVHTCTRTHEPVWVRIHGDDPLRTGRVIKTLVPQHLIGYPTHLRYSHQWLTLVPISAQLELTLPLSAQLEIAQSPIPSQSTHGCVPKVLKLSSNVSDVFPKVLKLSSEVSECKALISCPIHTVEYVALLRYERRKLRRRSGERTALPDTPPILPPPRGDTTHWQRTADVASAGATTSSQGLTLVPISAQLELTLPVSAQPKLTLSPIEPDLTSVCVPRCSS